MSWIANIKQNGNDALKDIYKNHRTGCITWLMKTYNLREAVAKDAFQLSMIILYQNVMKGKVEDKSCSLKSYLFAIAKNKARELLKTESKYSGEGKINLLKEELMDGVSEKVMFEQVMTKVQRALIKMGEPCKTILQLYYFKKMRLQEIAVLVGHKKPGTTKTKKHKCIKRLSGMVSDYKVLQIES